MIPPAVSRRKSSWVQKLLATIIFLLAAAWLNTYAHTDKSANLGASAEILPGYYQVEEIVDGDTIIVNMSGKSEIIRLIGVDTPETHHPSKPVQCFGYAATDHTSELIGNFPVRLEADDLSSNRDRYDRLLRYVYLPDGTLINQKIVEDGYGFAYTSFEFSKASEFVSSEESARSNDRGLWSACPLPN